MKCLFSFDKIGKDGLWLILILCLLYIPFSSAQTSNSFEAATVAFAKGDFKNAIQSYEAILAGGMEGEALYYNLGNSYYKDNQLGKAILNYERALLLDSGDDNTKINLQIAKYKVKGEIDQIPPFFLRSWWNSARNLLGANIWGIIALLFFWGAMAGLSLWQIRKDKDQKKKGFLAGSSLLLLTVIPFSLAWSAYQYQQNTNEGVLITTTASLKSGAAENSAEIRIIYEGTSLEMMDQINIWHKVRLENGEIGWLNEKSFEEI
jgi:tetratricopeptide (TPR) repeat protein